MSCARNRQKTAQSAARCAIPPLASSYAGLTSGSEPDLASAPLPAPAPAQATAPAANQQTRRVEQALAEVLAQQGKLDWPAMARRSGLPVSTVQKLAVEAGLAFVDPAQARWQPREEYLAGNIREKLRQAERYAVQNPLLKHNITALRQALPPDLKPHEIEAQLGAGWIPEQDIRAFSRQVLGIDLRPLYIARQGRWQVATTAASKRLSPRQARKVHRLWGAKGKPVQQVLRATLNSKEITVRSGGRIDLQATYQARDTQDRLRQAFSQWLWADPNRAKRLAARYNDTFNATVPPRFDGSQLGRLPGMTPDIQLRPHQKNSVWRLLRSKENTFLIHATGAGKTNIMVAATMEQKRLRLRHTIAHIVPNHRLTDHAADFKRLYPKARLLLVSSEMLSKGRYEATLQEIAASGENYDAVLLSHSAFERIALSPTTRRAGLAQQIAEVDEAMALLRPSAVRKRKLLQQERNRLVKKLEKLKGEPAGAGLTWEDLSVDQIYCDEAHRYRNKPFATRHSGIRSISPAGSARAQDAYLKFRHTQFRCPRCGKFAPETGPSCPACRATLPAERGGNLCLASATPIDNSLAELYTWQSILQPRLLQKLGLQHFDAWSAHFARPTAQFEIDVAGKSFREVRRFRNFSNVPELTAAFSQVADVQLDPEKLGLPLPEVQREDVVVPLSAAQQAYLAACERRAERVRARAVPPTEDNFLKIANDMQLAALDMRLVDRTAPDAPTSLLNQAVDRIIETYRRTTGVEMAGELGKQNLTQVIFLDVGTPGGSAKINLYADIKRKLVAAGLPAGEIAFIHQAKNDVQKAEIFARMNRGELRVLLASTPLAGEGANFQERLHTLLHLDVPWTPARMKQREGRIVRQGNLNPRVKIVRMTSPGPTAYRWQTIERKALAGDQLLAGDQQRRRQLEDVDDFHADYASIKAATSGNPLLRQKFELQSELQRLRTLEQAHLAELSAARQAVQQARAELDLARHTESPEPARIEELAAALAEQEELATLAERPFAHTTRIEQVQRRLNALEAEIAAQSRPTLIARQNQSVVGKIGRLFGLGRSG